MDTERYARHLVMPEVGMTGQKKLNSASVLCVGAGGLGSPALFYLAAAGVGRIGIVDADKVDRTNLQRQILHTDQDVGRPKTDSAREKLLALNPTITVETHEQKLTSANAREIISQYDLVIDGTDNFPARYLINDVCVWQQKPNVHGSIFRFEGQLTVFHSPKGPCYRCLYPEPPSAEDAPNCAEAGVLGVLPGIVGSLQALEAIKLILGVGDSLVGRLLQLDTLSMDWRQFKIRRNPVCVVCGDAPTITDLIDYEQFCSTQRREPEEEMEIPQISVEKLKQMREEQQPFLLLDVREAHELDISRLDPCTHIPMGDVPERLAELDAETETVVICRSGRRSNDIAKILLKSGFRKVSNLAGGINAYAERVDKSLRSY